jgi:tetratricopeptide (TPR) repeat protein
LLASRPKAGQYLTRLRGVGRAIERPLEDELNKLSSTHKRAANLSRNFALALALASGTAILAVPGFTGAAYAQKKDKKKEEAKPAYSKEFVAAYQPLNTALAAPETDVNALRPQVEALLTLAVAPDEQLAAGGLVYNAGNKLSDRALQLKGMETMLGSGKLTPADSARYHFVAYQLANALQQYPKSRGFLQKAIDAGFSTETFTTADLEITMAESYFSANEFGPGLDYLDKAIKARKASGQAVDAQWYRRGITVAYNNQVVPQVYDFVVAWLTDYPSAENWRDGINLTRNLNDYEGPEILDLLRLSRKAGVLSEKSDYLYYIEAADARRLPKEVKDVIDEAYAKNAVSKDDIFVTDSLATANGRIKTDQAELPALEKDANAAAAGVRTVFAAGDAFLSYGQYAKAAGFYEKSLGMAGVDRNAALTRLGISQVGVGDYAAAQATFAKIDGTRGPIARLWSAFAAQQAGGTTMAATGE